jgi:hypothetical protein
MTGFPEAGEIDEIGHEPFELAGPVSLSSYVHPQQGPGPQQNQRQTFKPPKPTGELEQL